MPTTQTDRIDGLTTSVAVKAPVKAVSTGNIAFIGSAPFGFQTIDGVAVSDNAGIAPPDRVLLKDQTDKTQNGSWDVAAGNWTRSLDFDGARDAVDGTTVYSLPIGTLNGDILWRMHGTNPIIFGTTQLQFHQLGSGQAGAGGSVKVTTVTSAYVATNMDGVIAADATGGAFNVALPPISSMALSGVYLPPVKVLKIDATANAVTVTADAPIFYNGGSVTTMPIGIPGFGFSFQAANSKWIVSP